MSSESSNAWRPKLDALESCPRFSNEGDHPWPGARQDATPDATPRVLFDESMSRSQNDSGGVPVTEISPRRGSCPFNTLGLKTSATPEEVNARHRALTLQCHPDRHDGDVMAAADAYERITMARKSALAAIAAVET